MINRQEKYIHASITLFRFNEKDEKKIIKERVIE